MCDDRWPTHPCQQWNDASSSVLDGDYQHDDGHDDDDDDDGGGDVGGAGCGHWTQACCLHAT